MNHNITVNTDTLKKDSQDITTKAENLRASLEEVYNEVKALDTMWDGPANEVFVQQFNGDYELLNALCDSVKAFGEDLIDASREYEKCEDSVESAVRSIKV